MLIVSGGNPVSRVPANHVPGCFWKRVTRFYFTGFENGLLSFTFTKKNIKTSNWVKVLIIKFFKQIIIIIINKFPVY